MHAIQYSSEERVFIVKNYLETKNYHDVIRRFETDHDEDKNPSFNTIRALFPKFETSVSVLDDPIIFEKMQTLY